MPFSCLVAILIFQIRKFLAWLLTLPNFSGFIPCNSYSETSYFIQIDLNALYFLCPFDHDIHLVWNKLAIILVSSLNPTQSLKSSLYLIQVHSDHSCASCTLVFIPNVKLKVMPFITCKLSRNASLMQFNCPKGKKCSLPFYPPQFILSLY